MEQIKESNRGKKFNQKLKPYLILQYLMRKTDENNPESIGDIIGFLNESGIEAERRSIYRDIEEINKVALMIEEDCTIEEAEDMLFDDEEGTLKLVVYDKHKKAYYVQHRKFDLMDIKLLAECVYSAKFVAEGAS